MCRIRVRVAEGRPALELVVPMFDARCFRPHEIVVVDGLPPFPDAIWPPEIRNAAAGRYARSGEDQQSLGPLQKVDQSVCFPVQAISVERPAARVNTAGPDGAGKPLKSRLSCCMQQSIMAYRLRRLRLRILFC